MRQAMDLLKEGVIGTVLVAKAWNSQKRGSIGKQQPTDPPPGLSAALVYDLRTIIHQLYPALFEKARLEPWEDPNVIYMTEKGRIEVAHLHAADAQVDGVVVDRVEQQQRGRLVGEARLEGVVVAGARFQVGGDARLFERLAGVAIDEAAVVLAADLDRGPHMASLALLPPQIISHWSIPRNAVRLILASKQKRNG